MAKLVDFPGKDPVTGDARLFPFIVTDEGEDGTLSGSYLVGGDWIETSFLPPEVAERKAREEAEEAETRAAKARQEEEAAQRDRDDLARFRAQEDERRTAESNVALQKNGDETSSRPSPGPDADTSTNGRGDSEPQDPSSNTTPTPAQVFGGNQ